MALSSCKVGRAQPVGFRQLRLSTFDNRASHSLSAEGRPEVTRTCHCGQPAKKTPLNLLNVVSSTEPFVDTERH